MEFPDFTVEEMVSLLRKMVQKRKFCLSRDVTDAKLTVYMRRAQLRAGNDVKNVRQVSQLMDEVIVRQTDSVFEEGCVSKEGLTKLLEKDFVGVGDKDQPQGAQD